MKILLNRELKIFSEEHELLFPSTFSPPIKSFPVIEKKLFSSKSDLKKGRNIRTVKHQSTHALSLCRLVVLKKRPVSLSTIIDGRRSSELDTKLILPTPTLYRGTKLCQANKLHEKEKS